MPNIKEKSSRKLQGEFQGLRKQYYSTLQAREYLVAKFGQIRADEAQKYIEEQEAYHRHDNFRIFEF
ncbi:MAG: transposase [Alphaproteobacteria bacterium]|nr:transposase [Alphaproteobacteria bacterium]